MLLQTFNDDAFLNSNDLGEAPIAQLGERRTLDRKVAGSILNRGAVLCP